MELKQIKGNMNNIPSNKKPEYICSVCGSKTIQGKWGPWCPNKYQHENGPVIRGFSPYEELLFKKLDLKE